MQPISCAPSTNVLAEQTSRLQVNFFRANVPAQAFCVCKEVSGGVNVEDLAEFIEVGRIAGNSRRMFLSHYSVGFALPGIEKGDSIFAIDGGRTPFILQKTGTQSYRVVGEYYLWAALELDCWIPGTRKGRWGPEVLRPTGKQTQMIEIW
jgi:hypothetical protein